MQEEGSVQVPPSFRKSKKLFLQHVQVQRYLLGIIYLHVQVREDYCAYYYNYMYIYIYYKLP